MLEGTLSFPRLAGELESLLGQYICLEIIGRPNSQSVQTQDGEMVTVSIRMDEKLKSATKEEMGRRRKTLHLATLKNFRDELSRELDANSKVVGHCGVRRIYEEFDIMIKRHQGISYEQYFVDTVYKKIATEAIETKSMAVLKIEIYVESVQTHCDDAVLERILARPFAEFARQTVVLELRTGIRNFPWTEVAQKSTSVDFGSWSPSGIESSKLDLVAQALAANEKLRAVCINGNELALKGGWLSKEIDWDNSAAVRSEPATAALLLRNCRAVTTLSLRSSPSILPTLPTTLPRFKVITPFRSCCCAGGRPAGA
jgi:hypothetical protein